MSTKGLSNSGNRVDIAYLIVCDCISYVLNETIQHVGTVSIIEELYNSILFGKWFELCDDSS